MPSIIYFLSAGAKIKIGITQNLRNRMASIRSQRKTALVLLGTVKGDRTTERAIHKALCAHSIGGEWYRDCRDVRAYIQNCLSNFDPASPIKRNTNFGRAWKGIYTFKAAEELASRAGCSVRAAAYELSGERKPSAKSIAALIAVCLE